MRTALVFTAYRRPQYFAPVLAAWSTARGWPGDWQPTVYLEPSPEHHAMSALARRYGLTVVDNPHRRGVLSNPWHALESAFAGHSPAGQPEREPAEFVVLAEDDVLVSDDILEYLSWAGRWCRDQQILAVNAASFAAVCAAGHEQATVRTKQFCPLIWGTWADRWYTVLRDTWDHDYTSGTPDAPQSGWDWNINLRLVGDWDILAPVASRVTHIGEHQGQHTTVASFPASVAPTFRAHRPAAPFLPPSNR